MTDGNMIMSVAKAMELLQLLNQTAKPMPLTELVQKSGYPKSTVFGLLATMRAYDVVTQTADGKYALGLRSISAPVYTVEGEVRYTVGVIGMFRSIHSDEFLAAVSRVQDTARMISTALGYRKQEAPI